MAALLDVGAETTRREATVALRHRKVALGRLCPSTTWGGPVGPPQGAEEGLEPGAADFPLGGALFTYLSNQRISS